MHSRIRSARTADLDPRCVFDRSGRTVDLLVTSQPEYSSMSGFELRDANAKLREGATTQRVETVSLDDLLDAHDAPEVIDYISVDTEGSELEIFLAFSWRRQLR